MPHNAFWGRSSGQVNVTRAGFAVSYFVSHTCWQPLPQRVNSVNANDSTAAGIKRLRRLKFKRCGELALRLSSRLTFAWVGVAILAIHSSRCITAGLLVYFIQMGAYQRACSCISFWRVFQRGRSCKSPDSQYATTDICGRTPAVR